MQLDLTDDQYAFRDSLGGLLQARYSWDERRRIVESAAGWSPDVWHDLAEFGVLALPFRETLGGLGGGGVEHLVVMEAFGEALVVEPYLSTVVVAGGLLDRAGTPAADALARAIIAGTARVAWAQGETASRYALNDILTTARRQGGGYRLDGAKNVVLDAPVATHLLVTARTSGERREADGVSLLLVEADRPGIGRHAYRTIDGRRGAALRFDGVSLGTDALLFGEGAALPEIERAVDEAAAAAAAEAVGAMRGLVRGTLSHLTERRQFGRPLAEFQVLQHRMADMFASLEISHAMALRAARAIARPAAERAAAVSAAKAFIGCAARKAGEEAVQLHGGMGMTDELPIGHYLKRAVAIEAQFGSTEFHVDRFAGLRRHD
ncbi:acyl-CoA dehydrogenase family protein [uncultured Sphingomonas sp.]|uniref:acyl-CoA dehydrogenase family protein n=1 Tax=uncultured Sphingomonas sp. TaxID=158754 RepID=UPI0035C946DD